MKLAKKLSLLTILATAALGTSYAADAQAKFTLQHPAQIGASVLPAGQYMVKMSADGATTAYIVPADRSGAAVIALPVNTDSFAVCKSSSLTMHRLGSVWSISSVCFADMQTALYFPLPSEKSTVTAVNNDAAAIAAAAK
jgi:hypothetical protein